MRVLLLVDCYLPDEKSSAMLIHELAREMAGRGHAITVLAPSPNLKASCEVEQMEPFRVVRFRTGRIKGAPLAVRAKNEMLLGASAWRRTGAVIEREAFDLVVYYSPSIFFGPLVAFLKRRWRVRTYLVLRDIFPDWAVQMGVMRRGPTYAVFKAFERLQYSAADRIGVETTGSVEYFRKTPHLGKVELLRNWTKTERVRPVTAGLLRRRLGLENKTVFLYGGNIGVAQDMNNIVRLASRMEKMKDVHFLLIGEGSEAERVRALAAAGMPGNLTVLPAVTQEDYLPVISQFDIGLISLDRRLKSFSTTGKLLGYLRCGLPVLASINPGNDLMQLLTDSGAGLCSWNGDDDVFYRNAVRLCSASVRMAMSQRSHALLEAEFSVSGAAEKILRIARVQVGTSLPTAHAGDWEQ